MINYAQFTPDQLVRTVYGDVRTVLLQKGCQVFVVEEPMGWYHPTKLFPIQSTVEPILNG